MKKKLFRLSILASLILAMSCSILSSFTQSEKVIVSGKVLNAETKEEIPFATVTITNQGVLVTGTDTNFDGEFSIQVEKGTYDIEANYIGFKSKTLKEVVVDKNLTLNFELSEGSLLDEVVVTEYKVQLLEQENTTLGKTVTAENIRSLPTRSVNAIAATSAGTKKSNAQVSVRGNRNGATDYYIDGVRVGKVSDKKLKHHLSEEKELYQDDQNFENYTEIVENNFKSAQAESFSTFSIDVDRASYANVRRYLSRDMMPPKDAVRIEEMINYFDYDYPSPKTKHPFELHTSLTDCPWNADHQILHVGLQGKEIDRRNLAPTNLVFLLDVSGSMDSPNKLPLVKESLKLLMTQLNDNDRIAIVTYAGASGLALASTAVKDSKQILKSLDNLRAGGGTAGARGIELAYKVATENFRKNGNNRVILCTDGDFNIGISSDDALVKLIEQKRKTGVFLSILGFGMGNYQEGKMQKLSSAGNGNHFYIDNIQEAKKTFISEFAGSLYAIAKDVKIQLEFNENHVEAYRLIGYENRMLEKKDFDDDKKDAGELGIGHTVTALYEIIPKGKYSEFLDEVSLPETPQDQSDKVVSSNELAHIKFRYKKPDGEKSILMEESIGRESKDLETVDERVKLSLAVAEFGILLRDSKFKKNASFDSILKRAKEVHKKNPDDYKKEFITLVEKAKNMSSGLATK